MKKLLNILISAVIVSGSVCSLAACGGKQPQEQTNNMSIKSVSQTAYGSINITLDVSGVEFQQDGTERYYYIQPSLDGGEKWFDRTVALNQTEISGGEFTYELVTYNSGDGYYYVGGLEPENRLEISGGDVLNIALRFKGDDNYLDSPATKPLSYALKEFSIFGVEMDYFAGESLKYGEEIIGTPRNEYIFQEQSDKSLKIKKVVSNAEVENEITDADPDILTGFEYKLILLSDYPDKNELMYGSPENYQTLSGWHDYNAETGVTQQQYNKYIADEFNVFENFDGNGNLTGTTNKKRTSVAIMVRQKETPTRLKSLMALTYYVISAWEEVTA